LNNNFAIGIPTLNRFDLLIPSILLYLEDFKGVDIHIIDNGQQNIKQKLPNLPNIYVYEEETNMGVAASWNKLCQTIFSKYNYAVILNDDVYLGYTTETVEKAIINSPVGLIQSSASWSVFVISVGFYDEIGDFDETFYPAYYEDSDYLYRMKLFGIRQTIDYSLNPQIARVSMTYEKDPELINNAMAVNRERYIEKWGGLPLMEQYLTPYNGIFN
jgi:GT2 family glycosyltransferase